MTYAIWYVFYFAALMMPVTKRDINFFISSCIVSSVVCSLIVLIARYDYGGGRLSIKIGNHIALDPNFLASFIMLGGALAFERLMKKRKGLIRKLFLLAVVALCTYTIIMTGSRAGVLAFVVCVFGSFVKLFLDNYRKMKLIHYVLLIGAIIAALVAMRYILPESIYQRIFHMNLADGSNSLRVAHWKSALKCWKQQPIFGYGPAMASDVLFAVDNHVGDAHNTYLVILLQFGVFGLALYAFIILDILKGLMNKKNVAYLFLLLGVLMSSFIIASQYSMSLWMPVLLCSWVSRDYVDNKKKKTKIRTREFQRVVNK
ncbi:MAG: O-antigen ligase family protein [Clostridia bacterium]|nr:O-antigen ligase family protein [Clostridia bacterium]